MLEKVNVFRNNLLFDCSSAKTEFFSALTALPLFNYHMWIRKKYRSLFLCRDDCHFHFQILKGYGNFTTTADFILVAPQVQVQFLKSVQGTESSHTNA